MLRQWLRILVLLSVGVNLIWPVALAASASWALRDPANPAYRPQRSRWDWNYTPTRWQLQGGILLVYGVLTLGPMLHSGRLLVGRGPGDRKGAAVFYAVVCVFVIGLCALGQQDRFAIRPEWSAARKAWLILCALLGILYAIAEHACRARSAEVQRVTVK